MPWESQNLNPHLPDSQAVELSLGVVGECFHMITTEATTEPYQCQCKRHQQEPDCLFFMARAKFSAWIAILSVSTGETRGRPLTDLIAGVIGYPSLGPVQLLL